MTSRKDIDQLIAELRRQGFEVKTSRRRSHRKVYQDGRIVGCLPNSPSDWRGIRNEIARLRRAGLIWPPKERSGR